MSSRMAKVREANRRVDLILDTEHSVMLDTIMMRTGASTISATIRAMIRREHAKTNVVAGGKGNSADGGDH